MKLDTDLIRDLLIYFEATLPEKTRAVLASEIQLPGYTSEQIVYHVELLIDNYYLKFIDASCNSGNDYFIERLTYDGHQFLSLMKSDAHWKTIRDTLGKIGLQALPILKELFLPLIKQQLGLP